MGVQSAALWLRVYAWLIGMSSGINMNDPVARVFVWSIVLWLLAAWAGWSLRRRDAITALAPALAILGLVADYTGKSIAMLWLLAVLTVALMGMGRYNANLRRWLNQKRDYAELISSNTLFALTMATVLLAVVAWFVPMISIKDILDRFRKPAQQSSVASSLGLEMTREPSRFAPYRAPGLPQQHLLGAGPELSKDLVFTVRTGELPPIPRNTIASIAPRHYWRSNVYDIYTGTGWVSSEAEDKQYAAGDATFETIPPGYRLLTQDFSLKHEDDSRLYWSGMLYSSDRPFEAAWRTMPGSISADSSIPFNGADPLGALNTSHTYRVESFIPEASVDEMRAAGRSYPSVIALRYLALPQNIPERVYALARRLTATYATPYDQARAIERYLRETYPYTLEVSAPPAGVDVADYFLFDLKKGYCDYYATSMAVLARAAGIPARLVTGYASGTYDAPSAEYRVTALNAHSWVEIYVPGTGWVEFEPTAGLPEIARTQTGPDPEPIGPIGAGSLWDAFIIAFGGLPFLARQGIIVLFSLLALALLWIFVENMILLSITPARALRWMYRDVYRLGGRMAGKPAPGTTATEFAAALEPFVEYHQQPLHLLTETYLRALFSPLPVEKRAIRQALKAWRSLRWRLLIARRRKVL
jgi:transglutaminase-like putative cysteine protease